MAKRIVHCCVDVSGVLRWKDKDLSGMIKLNGQPATGHQVRQWLLTEQQKGHEVVPFGEPCDGFDYVTGCPGHETDKGEAP